MAYKINEVIKTELEVLNVAYEDDMTNAELQALLDDATDAPELKPDVKPETQAQEVTVGVATINDHEKRIFALENSIFTLMEMVKNAS